ncbi:MAG: hypothetical protein ABJA84_00030 [Polaromonas sp.]
MAVSQTDIDNLNQAIATGARSVTLGGQTITYNTTQNLIAARNDLQAQLDAQSPERKRRRRQTLLYQSGRGY